MQNCARQRPTLSSKATWHQSPSQPSVARRMLEPMASELTAVPRPVKMTHRLHHWGLGQGQSHHGQMLSQWQRTLGQKWTFLWCHLWECHQSMPTPPSPKWLPVSHCAPFTGSLVGGGGGGFLFHSFTDLDCLVSIFYLPLESRNKCVVKHACKSDGKVLNTSATFQP